MKVKVELYKPGSLVIFNGTGYKSPTSFYIEENQIKFFEDIVKGVFGFKKGEYKIIKSDNKKSSATPSAPKPIIPPKKEGKSSDVNKKEKSEDKKEEKEK